MKLFKNYEILFLILFILIIIVVGNSNIRANDNSEDIYSNPLFKINKFATFSSDLFYIGDDSPSTAHNQIASDASDKSILQAQNSTSTTYEVKSGDTLWDIAANYNTTVEELRTLNNLTSDALSLGENLIISGQVQETETPSSRQQTLTPSRSGSAVSQSGLILQFAAKFLYTPYKWGGSTPGGFDCSGFVQYVFGKFGYILPRTAAEQATVGIHVDKSNLMPGDLVFFNIEGSGISHVGIYVGNGTFINSSSPYTGGVIYSSLSESTFARTYVGAKRLLR